MLRRIANGSHVTSGSLELATGTERGPNRGLAASNSACPRGVIGAGGSSVVAGPIQTPLRSERGCEIAASRPPSRHPGKTSKTATATNTRADERIERLQFVIAFSWITRDRPGRPPFSGSILFAEDCHESQKAAGLRDDARGIG